MDKKTLEQDLPNIAWFVYNKTFKNRTPVTEDCIQSGVLAAYEHLDDYDETKGTPTTFFYRYMKRAMIDEVIFHNGSTRYLTDCLTKIKKQYKNSEEKLEKSSIAAIAKKAKISSKAVINALNTEKNILIDEMIPVATDSTPEELTIKMETSNENKHILSQCFNGLSVSDKEYICDMYGVFNHKKLSKEEMCEKYHLSKDKISYKKRQLLKKMRKNISVH